MAEEAPSDRDEVEDKLRKLLKKTQIVTVGELGLAANGWLNDEGCDKLFDTLRLHGYSFVRK